MITLTTPVTFGGETDADTTLATTRWDNLNTLLEMVEVYGNALSTIAGSVTTGMFTPGEQVKQNTSGATATLSGSVPSSGPMTVGAITGTPDATDIWVGQSSGAQFTPTAAPVAGFAASTQLPGVGVAVNLVTGTIAVNGNTLINGGKPVTLTPAQLASVNTSMHNFQKSVETELVALNIFGGTVS